MSYEQWSFNERHQQFTGMGTSVPRLPAGSYAIDLDHLGNPRAALLEMKPDRLYRFASGPMPGVLQESEQFWRSRPRYDALGVTFKRSLLLYGPPGCGKSCIISGLIQQVLDLQGLVVRLDRSMDEFTECLPLLRQIERDRPILVLAEDLDSLCRHYEEDLLEVLDSTTSLGGGLLFVSTTNFLVKVPARIRCRPSRVDTLIEVPLPTTEQRQEYLTFLYQTQPVSKQPDAPFLQHLATATHGLSLAALKELVLALEIYNQPITDVIQRLLALTNDNDNN